jgi:peptide/nickel transport system permease protein
MGMTRLVGAAILVVAVFGVLAAPWLAPNAGDQQFRDHLYAPPMRVRIIDADGGWHLPFVYRWRLADRVLRTFDEDRTQRLSLTWFVGGHFVGLDPGAGQPLLLLGADSLGRDILSRLLLGARTTLGVAVLASAGALLLGLLVGGVAGYAGGVIDETLMRLADLVLVLPTIYVVLALRAVLPLVLPPAAVFWLLVVLLTVVAWPYVARGVRAIVAAERRRDYALAAVALGAGPVRILGRHLLPATTGFLTVQAALLLPAFILAEATLSFVGLGFAPPAASWGVMLQEASNIRAIADFPWLLSPAVAIIVVVLGVNLVTSAGTRGGALGLVSALESKRSSR